MSSRANSLQTAKLLEHYVQRLQLSLLGVILGSLRGMR